MAVPHFHRLRIREVRPETDQAVSVAFEVPHERASCAIEALG